MPTKVTTGPVLSADRWIKGGCRGVGRDGLIRSKRRSWAIGISNADRLPSRRGQLDESAETAGEFGRVVVHEQVRAAGDELDGQLGGVLSWDAECVVWHESVLGTEQHEGACAQNPSLIGPAQNVQETGKHHLPVKLGRRAAVGDRFMPPGRNSVAQHDLVDHEMAPFSRGIVKDLKLDCLPRKVFHLPRDMSQ